MMCRPFVVAQLYTPAVTEAPADSAVAATSDIPTLPAAVDHNRSAAAAGPDDSAAPAAAAAAAVDTGATGSSDASAAASAAAVDPGSSDASAAVATDAPSTSAPASAAVAESDSEWLGQFNITEFTSVVLQFTI